MKKISLLHQERHPKDLSRCSLQRMHRETCGPVFEDLLGVEKSMVACHKPNNLNDPVIPSRMKVCMKRDLRSSAYVKNQTESVVGVPVKEIVKDIVLDDGVSPGIRERE